MNELLHTLVRWAARAHDYILTLNDRFEYTFSDKELHFMVIGAIGLMLILMVYPVFKLLSSHNRVLAITWIYVLTVLVVLTFAIEIGQQFSGTGSMDFGDVVAGMGGFFAVTAAITALRLILWAGRSLARAVRGAGRRAERA